MRFTIEYIPLKRIDANAPVRLTDAVRRLRRVLWDGSYLLAVRKNRRGGRYTVVAGHDRYNYLKAHTNRIYVPCVLDTGKDASSRPWKTWLRSARNRRLLSRMPHIHPDAVAPAAWSILRAFAKEDTKFARLTRIQQIKVLLLAVRYKRTVVSAMKAAVEAMSEAKAE